MNIPSNVPYHRYSCFPAHLMFLKFSRLKMCTGVYKLERIWELFWNKYHKNDLYENFIDLFQFIQVKNYSEAICETVGSVMNIHHGRGRNLHPVNLNKELFLQFNLPSPPCTFCCQWLFIVLSMAIHIAVIGYL